MATKTAQGVRGFLVVWVGDDGRAEGFGFARTLADVEQQRERGRLHAVYARCHAVVYDVAENAQRLGLGSRADAADLLAHLMDRAGRADSRGGSARFVGRG